jgi:predicted AlkP superfamily phosphohydrolase/phosphomutase
MKQSSSKVLIIGIDGGTWEVLAPACERGLMPNLNRFRSQGCWGTLHSTIPPITPAAWVALMTGQNPGHHGVRGFQEYDPATNQVRLTSSQSIKTETLWQKLARHGKRVVVVGVPMTYPPLEVNGILVSGFDTPSIESEFTYPASFKQEILEKIPDFTFERVYRTKQLKEPENFVPYLNWLRRQSEQMVQILRMGMEKVNWDISMILLRSFDEMLHRFWKLIDFNFDTSSNPRDAHSQQYFRDLDEVIGQLLKMAGENQAVVYLVSDHGGQAILGSVYPNRVLRKLGYLKQVSNWQIFLQKIQKRLHRRSPRTHLLAKMREPNPKIRQINLKETRAYITQVNLYADLNLQVKNRQPYGIVETEDAEALIEEIATKLREIKNNNGHPIFKFVRKPAEIYGIKESGTNLSDLLLAPREGYITRTHVTGNELIVNNTDESLSGTHSFNGMFGVIGPEFKRGQQINAEIIDIAPTILAALNLPVTEDMNGKVVKEAFEAPPEVVYESPQKEKTSAAHDYSQQEQAEIRSRLADLGYL